MIDELTFLTQTVALVDKPWQQHCQWNFEWPLIGPKNTEHLGSWVAAQSA